MPSPTNILMIGLDPSWFKANRPNQTTTRDTSAFFAALDKSIESVKSNPNFHAEIYHAIPDNAEDFETLKNKIREGTGPEGGNRPWDGILIGFGLRTDLELTPLFQDMINYVHATLPKAAIVFSSRPDDHLEAIQRSLKVE